MLKKKGAPSFKPKAGVRRNPVPAAAKSQSGTPAPTQTSVSNDSPNASAPSAAPAISSAASTTTPVPASVSHAATAASSVPIQTATPPVSSIGTSQTDLQAAESSASAQTSVIADPVEQSLPAQSNVPVATISYGAVASKPAPQDASTRILTSPDISTGQGTTPSTTARGDAPSDRTEDTHVAENTPVVSRTDTPPHSQAPLSAAPCSTASASVDDAPTDLETIGAPGSSGPTAATRKRGAPGTISKEATSAAPSPKRRRATGSTGQDTTVGATETNATSQSGSRKRRKPTTQAQARAQPQETAGQGDQADGDPGLAQPKRKARTKTATTPAIGENGEAVSAQPKTRTRKSSVPRVAESAGESADDAEGTAEAQARKKPSRKSRKERSVTPDDAEERAIDPSSLTMAELTKDLRIGKKFSRHDELRDRMKTLQEKQREERRLRKANGRTVPGDEEATALATGVTVESEMTPAPTGANVTASSTQPAALGPQFEIINGEIVINQASLVHDRHAAAMANQADMEEVEENDFTRMTNQTSYIRPTKIKGPNSWTKEETQEFYEYLRMFGTDFQTIANMFPGRMRRHVKMKFNREERHNPTGVNAALVGQKVVMIDLDEYQTRTGKALERTADIEEEHRQRAEQHETEQKRIQDEADAVQAEKRKKLLGTGTDIREVTVPDKTKKKDTSDGKNKGVPKTQTEIMEEEGDVEVIDEDEVESRRTPRRRGRILNGIGG